MLKRFLQAKVGARENVEYVLRDKDGNIKPLFQPNGLFLWLLKKGIVSPTNTSPLFGHYANSMVLSNLVTNAGIAGVAGRINASGAPAAFTYIALGIGTTAANAADTTLESEVVTVGGERAVATASLVTTTVADDTAQLQKTFTFTAGAALALTESGVLNAAAAGTLLARQVFAAINVVPTDALQVTWKFAVSTV